jgi:hypothetical protein
VLSMSRSRSSAAPQSSRSDVRGGTQSGRARLPWTATMPLMLRPRREHHGPLEPGQELVLDVAEHERELGERGPASGRAFRLRRAHRWGMLAGATMARPRRCSPVGDARWSHYGMTTRCLPEGMATLSLYLFQFSPCCFYYSIIAHE